MSSLIFNGITWEVLHPRAGDLIGLIPEFIFAGDERKLAAQIDENYSFGGGWSPMKGWGFNMAAGWLTYPGDPPYRPVASATLRGETLYVYEHAWVCIVQADGSFEVSRMD